MPPPADLARLYDDHAQALFAFLLNLTQNEADTRDLLQELFAKLARRPASLPAVRAPRAFLLRLAHNAAIDWMRRRGTREKNYQQLAADTAAIFAPASDPDEQAFRQALTVALGELPPATRGGAGRAAARTESGRASQVAGGTALRSHRCAARPPPQPRRQPLSL